MTTSSTVDRDVGVDRRRPALAKGTRLLGEYLDSGFDQPHYLVARADEQMLQVSEVIYLVAKHLNGDRDTCDIAQLVSNDLGRTLTADGVEFVLDHRLAPMGLLVGQTATATATATAREGRRAPGRHRAKRASRSPNADPWLSPRFRGVLVPARLTQRLAGVWAPAFHPWVVATCLVTLVVSDVWLITTTDVVKTFGSVRLDSALILFIGAMVLVSTLFHELGHAAATRYGGATPGEIGVAVYIVYPAFYTNVTDAYRLNRVGRIRTDLGGVYFNALSILAMTAGYHATGYAPLLLAVIFIHLEALQQLMPLARLDGHFVLADLVGVPDLFTRIGPILVSLIPGRPVHPKAAELNRRARVVVSTWVLTAVPIMAALFLIMLWTAPTLIDLTLSGLVEEWALLSSAITQSHVPDALLSALSLVLIPLPVLGLGYLIASGARRLTVVLARLARRRLVMSKAGST